MAKLEGNSLAAECELSFYPDRVCLEFLKPDRNGRHIQAHPGRTSLRASRVQL